MGSLLTTAVAAVATLLGVLAGGLLARRTQESTWLRDTKNRSYSAVLDAYVRIEADLRAAYTGQRAPGVDWAPWGAALTALSLVAEDAVATAAERMSRTLIRMEEIAHGGGQYEEWRSLQQRLVEEQMAFVNTARRSLDRSQPRLDTRIGGPLLGPTDH